MSTKLMKWFDLNHPSKAKLKLAYVDGVLHALIVGLSRLSPVATNCVNMLGFHRVPNKSFLSRRVQDGEKLTEGALRKVFPNVRLVLMPQSEFLIGQESRSGDPMSKRASVDLRGLVRLGRNPNGEVVYDGANGRVIITESGKKKLESEADASSFHDFLRLAPRGAELPDGLALKESLLSVSAGFIRSMDAGEVQHSEDYAAFRDALFGQERERLQYQAEAAGVTGDALQQEIDRQTQRCNELLSAAIDAALLVHVRAEHDVAVDAYGPIARLYDYLPAYKGLSRGKAAMPQPLSVAAQRLLGDTAGKTILYPQAFDGSAFAFLPRGTKVRACTSGRDFDIFRIRSEEGEDIQWLSAYSPIDETGADGLFLNMDPQPGHDEYRIALQAIRSLAVGARAVLVLAADEVDLSGRLSRDSVRFVQSLSRSYSLDGIFESAPILSRKAGATNGLRVFALRNVTPDGEAADKQEQLVNGYIDRGVPVLSSWDAVKAHVTELMVSMSVNEAQSNKEQADRAVANESYQRPYIAFSKLGEARTMSPANLQASAQAYLTRLEQAYGPVDDFVARELGMGYQTLAQRFSPEQIDAVAVMVSRYIVGRSSILADDTGIGKGRSLAAVATWANKHGHDVFFVTDRANLFSDLARDLNDIGEWDRFRPLVFNADGEITVDDGPGGAPRVLATGVNADVMAEILAQDRSMSDIQANIGFLTYSQISSKDSQKALWLKNQLANALVIFDEAHIAAGSDSNVAVQVSEIAALAKHVQFSSATWAKTHDNLHIYQRALPASVTISTLTETMRKGGDSFAEIFSTMLSAEGALIRREHDLSKLDVEMVIDEANRNRNEEVSDLVADVLGAAAYISGDMQQVFMRRNAESVKKLREARDARSGAVKANLFSSGFGGGSVIYQIMKTVQGALNAEHVADLAVKSRAQGMKPVIVTDATGEALVSQLIEEMRQEVRQRREADGANTGVDEDINEIRMPTLRDALRLVVLKRLSMVKVEVVTADDVADQENASLTVPQGTTTQPALAPDLSEEDEVDLIRAAVDENEIVQEDGVDLHQAARTASANTGDEEVPDDEAAQVPGVKRRRRHYREVSILEHEGVPPEAREKYLKGLEEITSKIKAVPELPILGFDVIANKLNEHGIVVGEISGRKFQLRPVDGSRSMMRLIPRMRSKRAVKATIRSFNSGAIDVVIINRSAAAGVSMHASPRFADQSRRQLIEHQIPENPVDRVQLLGRVNRFDQLTSPLITTASTGIYGEVRYLMMQNRKLARMSANVRSSRDNAMALKGVTDLFNPVGRSAVKGFLLDNPLVARRLGISDIEIEQYPDLVNRLTMRIPLLTVAQQKMVYTDVYARFDEIVLRAEMDGSNPLRPHELNVRAETESEVVFFGDDTTDDVGMISAFDAPVVARRIKWTEFLNPLRYENVLDASNIARERLIESGFLTLVNVRNRITEREEAHPRVDPEIVAQLTEAYHGLVRLAHQTTGEQSLQDSVMKHAVVKRAWVKYQWMKMNLPKIVPGSKIGTNRLEADPLVGESFSVIVTDVKPPEKRDDYMDAGKWKITTVTTGDERARTYSLRSLLTAVEGEVSVGGVTGELHTTMLGPFFAPGLFGVSQESLRSQFDFAVSGRRVRSANVLTGNMYLAAEWSAAVGKGTAINYSDSSGRRHRVIQLPSEMDRIDPNHLPVRIADPLMLQKFLMPLLYREPQEDAAMGADGTAMNLHLLDSSFRSAMAYASGVEGLAAGGKRDAVFVVVPNKMIAMSCSPKDARRIRAALANGQKAMRVQSLGGDVRAADDPLNVEIRAHTAAKEIKKLPAEVAAIFGRLTVVRTGDLLGIEGVAHTGKKETKASVITMRFETADQAHRAIDLIRMHSGLELYATTPMLKELAREVIRRTMVERREEIERLRVDSRREIERVAQEVQQAIGTRAPADAQISVPGEGSDLAEEAQDLPVPT